MVERTDEFKFKVLYYAKAHGIRKASVDIGVSVSDINVWNRELKVIKLGSLWTTTASSNRLPEAVIDPNVTPEDIKKVIEKATERHKRMWPVTRPKDFFIGPK